MFKVSRALWCALLVLCVSGFAYAGKGAGAHAAKKLFRVLPTGMQNGLGTAKSKLLRAGLVALTGFTLVCGGISGCGSETPTASIVTSEAVINSYNGESVYFEIGNSIHEGDVIEGVSANEVLVRLGDNREMVITVDTISGTLLADHPELGVEVFVLSDREGEFSLLGNIVGVYSDGMRKIEFFGIRYTDGRFPELDPRRIGYVRESTGFEEGGYLTTEEYAEWLDAQ